MTRTTTEEQRNWLKTACKRVVYDIGGLDAAQSCTRVRSSHLSDYGNLANEKMMPVDVVLDLEAITGQPHVTSAMAAILGRALVVVTPLRPKNDLAVLLARVGEYSVQLFADAAHALAHKHPSKSDRIKLRADIAAAINVLRETDEWLAREGQVS